MATQHDVDGRVEGGGDAGADLVGRGEQVEADPPRSGLVDDVDGVVDAQAVGLGVQDADVEALRGGVGGQVAHAEHRQGEVVDARALGVVAQRCVDEERVQRVPEVCAGDRCCG